jgi:hypothetical protein
MMVQLTQPKRYTIITDYSNGKKTILESEDGFWVKYTNAKDYTLNYANELAKQARIDALEEAAHWIEHNEIWLPVSGGTPSVKPTTPQDVGANYRALAAEIRKLKEATFTGVKEQPVGSAEQNHTEGV